MDLFLHTSPLDELMPALRESLVANDGSESLWDFESVGYLDSVEPSWLHGNSYLWPATDFPSSPVITTSPNISPASRSSLRLSTSPEQQWKLFLPSGGVDPASVTQTSDLSPPSADAIDSPSSTNAVGGPFQLLPSETFWENDNCSPKHEHSPASQRGSPTDNTGKHCLPFFHLQSSSFDTPQHALHKGLSGWGDPTDLKAYKQESLSPSLKSRGSQSPLDIKPDASRGTALSFATTSSRSPAGRDPRHARNGLLFPSSSPCVKAEVTEFDLLAEDEPTRQDDQDDSDDYKLSCSPSPGPSPSSSLLGSLEDSRKSGMRYRTPKNQRAPGSAALALAVVTQVREARREAQRRRRPDLELDLFDTFQVYKEGGYEMKKRKNQPIPVPIPVPNLNKKSRGRKVPFISPIPNDVVGTPTTVKTEDESIEGNMIGRSRRKHRKGSSTHCSDHTGSRTFICVVPGCGKCFVRGEHLKRHVRSIHTHDKPHICPFEECKKSFSRRDNLGQHVRIHLQE